MKNVSIKGRKRNQQDISVLSTAKTFGRLLPKTFFSFNATFLQLSGSLGSTQTRAPIVKLNWPYVTNNEEKWLLG